MRNLGRIFSLLLVLCLGIAACGGGEPVEPAPAPAASGTVEEAPPPAEPEPETPKSSGEEAYAIFLTSLTKVTELMEEGLEPADLEAKVKALKEEAIAELVAIGRKREEMSEGDREAHDRAVRMATFGTTRELYERFTKAQGELAKTHRELANEIASFNVIGQYGIFELLKKQLPEEAKRLGIE